MKPTANLWHAKALTKGSPDNNKTGNRINPAPPPAKLEKKQATKDARKLAIIKPGVIWKRLSTEIPGSHRKTYSA